MVIRSLHKFPRSRRASGPIVSPLRVKLLWGFRDIYILGRGRSCNSTPDCYRQYTDKLSISFKNLILDALFPILVTGMKKIMSKRIYWREKFNRKNLLLDLQVYRANALKVYQKNLIDIMAGWPLCYQKTFSVFSRSWIIFFLVMKKNSQNNSINLQ